MFEQSKKEYDEMINMNKVLCRICNRWMLKTSAANHVNTRAHIRNAIGVNKKYQKNKDLEKIEQVPSSSTCSEINIQNHQ